jgi:hypothetical protein
MLLLSYLLIIHEWLEISIAQIVISMLISRILTVFLSSVYFVPKNEKVIEHFSQILILLICICDEDLFSMR